MWPFKSERQEPTEIVEITMGENDLLVIETKKTLSRESRENLIAHLQCVINEKSSQVLILDSDMKVKVVHR